VGSRNISSLRSELRAQKVRGERDARCVPSGSQEGSPVTATCRNWARRTGTRHNRGTRRRESRVKQSLPTSKSLRERKTRENDAGSKSHSYSTTGARLTSTYFPRFQLRRVRRGNVAFGRPVGYNTYVGKVFHLLTFFALSSPLPSGSPIASWRVAGSFATVDIDRPEPRPRAREFSKVVPG
jgi:hypothetical protein